jgi:hypothetical protein
MCEIVAGHVNVSIEQNNDGLQLIIEIAPTIENRGEYFCSIRLQAKQMWQRALHLSTRHYHMLCTDN